MLDADHVYVADLWSSGDTEQLFGAAMPQWVAPELLLGASDGSTSLDIYSFAIVLFAMVDGRMPFCDQFPTPLAAAFGAAHNGSRPQVSVSVPYVGQCALCSAVCRYVAQCALCRAVCLM